MLLAKLQNCLITTRKSFLTSVKISQSNDSCECCSTCSSLFSCSTLASFKNSSYFPKNIWVFSAFYHQLSIATGNILEFHNTVLIGVLSCWLHIDPIVLLTNVVLICNWFAVVDTILSTQESTLVDFAMLVSCVLALVAMTVAFWVKVSKLSVRLTVNFIWESTKETHSPCLPSVFILTEAWETIVKKL